MHLIIKKYKKILIAILILLILIPVFIYILSRSNSKKITVIPTNGHQNIPLTSPTPATLHRQQNLDKLVSGKSSPQDVTKILGEPTRTDYSHGYSLYYYLLPPTQRENIIFIRNNTVRYIMEEIPVDNTLYMDYVNQSGTAADGYIYDDVYNEAGFVWYIFSNKGVAFLANPSNGYTIEILYFKPMSYSDFLDSVPDTFDNMDVDPPKDVERFHENTIINPTGSKSDKHENN